MIMVKVQEVHTYIKERVKTGVFLHLLHYPQVPDGDGSDDTGLEERSQFGRSVAIDGNYAIVGAVLDSNERGRQAGSAYIYERNSDGWNNPIHLTLPNIDGGGTDDTGLEEDSRFGVSVAISQTHAIIVHGMMIMVEVQVQEVHIHIIEQVQEIGIYWHQQQGQQH